MNQTGKLGIIFVLSAAAATIGCTGKGQANTQPPAATHQATLAPVEKNPLTDPAYRQKIADKLFAEEEFQVDSLYGTYDGGSGYLDTYNIRKINDDGHLYKQTVLVELRTAKLEGKPEDEGRRIETLAPKPTAP